MARTDPGSTNLYRRYVCLMAEGDDMDRIVFYSDAVFAIAMTLLIIDIHVPDVGADDLGPALLGLIPGYLAFILSFVVTGMVWMSHHRKFRKIVRYNQTLVRLSLLLLLFVASIPLPTAMLAAYGDQVLSVYVYAGTICLVGFVLTGIWIYAWHAKLVDPELPVDVYRFVLVQSFPIPGIFLLSIPIAALAGPTAAEVSWVLAIPVSVILPRVYAARATARTESTQ